MDGTIAIRIDGREVGARPGATILEAARECGAAEIPTLCNSPELEPYGSCFLCVVEVKGRPNLLPACATRVAAGMEIETRSERVLASRRTALELLLSNHYADCVPPCRLACPAGVDTQGYLALAAMGRVRQAVDLIREANPLPAVCGRVCVRKCEVDCRRADVDGPVGINAVKRYVTDAEGVYDGGPDRAPPTGKSVGIVGGGPAGLAAAWFLARKGHRPVIYESMEKAGGMLRYGIPAYRLPGEVIDREIDYILRAGAELRTGVRVGKDISLDELRALHDAVFLAAGAWAAKPMGVKGDGETEGIVPGIDFLRERSVNRTPLVGTVVVVGGGNTAMDVARTSWRLGADKVIILYRRTKAEMPADKLEIEDCLAEGIELLELAAPVGIVADGGRLKALRCIRMKLGEPDASGRRRPVPLEGSDFDLPCDLAVSAIGQEPVLGGLETAGSAKIDLTKWGTYAIDRKTLATNVPGVFAGGDAADDGPSVVIDAVADAGRAARSIHAYLTGEEPEPAPFLVSKAFWGKPGKAEMGEPKESPRHEVHQIDVEARRGNFEEVATGFEPEDNAHETARCLSCGCVRYSDCDLRRYAEEYRVDLGRFKGHIRKHRVDDRHPYIIYDPNKCILCARCIRTCGRMLPLSALGLIGRGFKAEVRPAMNDPLVETSCVSCGNCIDACPTAALTARYAFPGRASLVSSDAPARCGFCALGCPVTVRRFGGDRYAVASSGVPGEYLCRYGRFGPELFAKRDRIVRPLVRQDGERREADFTEAFRRIAERLRAAASRHGPGAVAVLVSPELTNEELYLAGRIAREGLGTGNVGSLTALGSRRETGELDASLGFTASTADRSVLADADLIVTNNADLETDHLVLAVDGMAAVRRGARLVAATSAPTAADGALATLILDPLRGRAADLWTGVLGMLLGMGGVPPGAVAALPGGDASIGGMAPDIEAAASRSGVEAGALRRAAELLRDARRIVFIHCPDRARDRSAGDLQALANLAIALRAAGSRVDLLLPRSIANSAGLEVVGADPSFGPGRRPAGGLPGATSHAAFRTILDGGRLRGAIVLGEDPMRHDATGAHLENLEFLAAMDWTETETTRAADVVLPGTTFLEGEGTRCNFEGRVLRYERAIEPPSGVPGWRVLAGLARAFGIPVEAASAEALTQEIESLVVARLGEIGRFYWNRGEERTPMGLGRPLPVSSDGAPAQTEPAIVHGERYKRSIGEVGTGRFRVS
jgi:formate dehydrogenase major subunit